MTLLDGVQLLGNVGEFLGAIAVVATLAYLAVQVRQTRSLIANQIHQSSFTLQASYLQTVGESAQVARVMVEGRRSLANLSDGERLQFFSVTSLGMNFVEHSFRQPEAPDSPEQLEDLRQLVLHLLDHPGGSEYWHEYRALFVQPFAAWVEQVLQARGPGAAPEDHGSGSTAA